VIEGTGQPLYPAIQFEDHRLGSKRIPVATRKIISALGTGDPHRPRAPQPRRVEPIA